METSWPNEKSSESDQTLYDGPKLSQQPYISKYATTYQPKSHYRYDGAYNIKIEDEVSNMIIQDKKSSNTEPMKRKPKPIVEPDDIIDGERKKSFISWVTNGKETDLGKAESYLFRKSKV